MTSMGVLHAIFMCIVRLQSRVSFDSAELDLWHVVEFVELLMLASAARRAELKQALAFWLLDDFQDPASSINCTGGLIGQLLNEIEAAWLLKQKEPSEMA